MRTLKLILIFGLVASWAGVATAQSTGAKEAPNPAPKEMTPKSQKYLDAYLKAWEERMSGIDALETKVVLTESDGPDKTVYTGEAALKKPNMGRMFLKQASEPGDNRRWRHYVADGEHMWDYSYREKVARVQKLPAEGLGDNTIMSFLFGMKAADIKKRYDLFIDVDDPERFSDFYIFIDILPRTKEDKQEFAKAQLVLWKDNREGSKFAAYWMLPARLWFQHTNKNQVTWEFQKMNTKKQLGKEDFAAPPFPDKKTWKSEWMKAPAQPVSRTVPPPIKK